MVDSFRSIVTAMLKMGSEGSDTLAFACRCYVRGAILLDLPNHPSPLPRQPASIAIRILAGLEVLKELKSFYDSLAPELQKDMKIVELPMDDVKVRRRPMTTMVAHVLAGLR